MMSDLYDQWLSYGVHQITKNGNMKPPSKKRIIEWVFEASSQRSKENIINSFKYCGLNLANADMEDDFLHCLKKGQPCEAGRQKLNSQLSFLVDKSDDVNLFTSPSDGEDANEEMNIIEDERDEEIIM